MESLIVILLVVLIGLAMVAVLALRRPLQPSAPTVAPIDMASIVEAVKASIDVGAISAGVQGAVEAKIRETADSVLRNTEESSRRQADERLRTQSGALEEQTKRLLQPFEQQMGQLAAEVGRLAELNREKFSSVDTAVEGLARQAQALNNVLSSAQGRGNWGERMLEDILSRSGFERGINYERQETLAGGGRPDYSIYLPPDRVLYLDSKFPADNYLKYFEAVDDGARAGFRDQFLRNIEDRIKELEKRDYTAQSGRNALDYVLLFIPNEGVMAFIQQHRPSLVDDAYTRRVVLCSPLNLYAFLGVVRQATDTFHMHENANEVLSLMSGFSRAWTQYVKYLTEIHKSFEKMQDRLRAVTTGRVMANLRKPLNELEDLAKRRGIEGDGDTLAGIVQAMEEADRELDDADEV